MRVFIKGSSNVDPLSIQWESNIIIIIDWNGTHICCVQNRMPELIMVCVRRVNNGQRLLMILMRL